MGRILQRRVTIAPVALEGRAYSTFRHLRGDRTNANDLGECEAIALTADDVDSVFVTDEKGAAWSGVIELRGRVIGLCRESGVQLVLVRYPNRRTAQRVAEGIELPVWASDWLPPYMEELFAYLADEGVAVLDFEGDPRVPFAWYASGDHLVPEPGMEEFTGFLAEELRPLLD